MNRKIFGYFLGSSKFAWGPPSVETFGVPGHVPNHKCATAKHVRSMGIK